MNPRPTTCLPIGRWLPVIWATLGTWGVLRAQDQPPAIPRPELDQGPHYPVARVIDERTVSLQDGDEQRTVALCGIGLPPREADRARLREFLANLLGGEGVMVEAERQSGGQKGDPPRVYLFRLPDGLFVNLEAVRQGYAPVERKAAFRHRQLLEHYQALARKVPKGIWGPREPAQAQQAEKRTPVPNRAADGDLIVYVTKSGKKYHREGCQYLRKSSQALTLREAVRRGYEPCSRCRPPTLKQP